MKARLLPLLTALFTLSITASAHAVAGNGDNGEGLLGETNDKIITFFSLGVIVFFFAVVCIGSWIQNRLDKRKDARKAEALKSRIGW